MKLNLKVFGVTKKNDSDSLLLGLLGYLVFDRELHILVLDICFSLVNRIASFYTHSVIVL